MLPPSAAADAGSTQRRRLALFGIPAALVLAVAAVRLASDPPSVETPVESVANSTASARNTAPLVQPAARSPLPAVLPPLITDAAPPSATPPPMASNTTPAPTDALAASVPPPGAMPLVRVTFAISPWGEIYIDGRKRGVTPPLTELALPPGIYAVEVRNASFAPMKRTIEVGVDSAIRIRHKFAEAPAQ